MKTVKASDYVPYGTVMQMPSGTARIESEAFAGVPMTEIDIPAGVNYIAEDAFDGCGLIAIYTHNAYVTAWAEDHGITAVTE